MLFHIHHALRTEQGPISSVSCCGVMTHLPVLRDSFTMSCRWEHLGKVFIPEGDANINLECAIQAIMTANFTR